MGKNNKRPKSYYIQSAKHQKRRHNVLGPGLQGFLCTCNNRERDCVREVYNLLGQFADKLYGSEQLTANPKQKNEGEENKNGADATVEAGNITKEKEEETAGVVSDRGGDGGGSDDDDDDEPDIDAALKANIAEMQSQCSRQSGEQQERPIRRFQQVESGATNCIFIKTTLSDPLPVSLAIMDHIIDTREQCTKRVLRMVPVQLTCKAFLEDIEKAAKQLADKFFEMAGKSFYIAFKSRNNSSVKREALTAVLVKVLQDAHPQNTPDMKTPEVVLNVEIMRSICCLSLLPGYFIKYAKYNLVTLATKVKAEQHQNGTSHVKTEEKAGSGQEKVNVGSQDEAVEDKSGQDSIGKGLDGPVKESVKGQDEIGEEGKVCIPKIQIDEVQNSNEEDSTKDNDK